MMKFPPYEKAHIFALIGTVTSIVVLITTLYCVWYPYLETANFVSADCIPRKVSSFGPVACSQQSTSTCATLPPIAEVIDYFNFTIWRSTVTSSMTTSGSTSSMTSTSSTSLMTSTSPTSSMTSNGSMSSLTTTSTTSSMTSTSSAPSMTSNSSSSSISMTSLTSSMTSTTSSATSAVNGSTANSTLSIESMSSSPTDEPNMELAADADSLSSAVTLSPGGSYCTSFPCIMVSVSFRTTYGQVAATPGYLYSSYDQLQSYPKCTYSACGSSNSENYKLVNAQFRANEGEFQCYVNVYTRPFLVLEQVNFSYAAAVNSILWPILALLVFGTFLIVLRCHAWSKRSSVRNRPSDHPSSAAATSREAPYSVHYVDLQSPGVTSFAPYPSTPAGDIGAIGGTGTFTGVGFPETGEKNPAMFLGGEFPAVSVNNTVVGPLSPAQWAVGYPPQYEEVGFSASDGAFDMPSNAASAAGIAANYSASSATFDFDRGENAFKY